jgi:hypothetical protein
MVFHFLRLRVFVDLNGHLDVNNMVCALGHAHCLRFFIPNHVCIKEFFKNIFRLHDVLNIGLEHKCNEYNLLHLYAL